MSFQRRSAPVKMCSERERKIKSFLSLQDVSSALACLKLQAPEEQDESSSIDPLPLVSTMGLAVRFGDVHTVKAVVESGFDPNVTSRDEDIEVLPVHIAIGMGKLDVVRLLVEDYHVRRNLCSRDTGQALYWAVHSGSLDMVKYLVDQGEVIFPKYLFMCIELDQSDVCAYMLSTGVGADEKNLSGHTLLYEAVRRGRGAIVKTLLQNGASMEGTFSRGNSLLHLAVISGDLTSVRTLCEHGACPHQKNKYGNSCLHLAALYGAHDIAHYLVVHCGVDVDVTDVDQQSAFVLALVGRKISIARLLVCCGYQPQEREFECLLKHNNNGDKRDQKIATGVRRPQSLKTWCMCVIHRYIHVGV